MTGLGDFSVRGLRRFQHIVLAIGLAMFGLVFTTDSILVDALLALSFFGLFFAFRYAEQTVARKQKGQGATWSKKRFALVNECVELFDSIERLFVEKGYSGDMDDNPLLKHLAEQFETCESIVDLEKMVAILKRRMAFVSQLQSNRKTGQEKRQEKKQEEKQASASTSPLSIYWNVLGLPEGTTDLVVIKKAYKKLVKEYHPDINKDSNAGEKTVQLNLAYEQLKHHIEAS